LPAPGARPDTGPVRLLVVDDETRFVKALAHGLGREGFVVDVAHDGLHGLELALSDDYDGIVLDLMLPGISGYEVLRRLRAADVWTPVLMLTAKDGEYDEADALDEGADDYLTKPFSFVVLLARLRALLRRRMPARPTTLVCAEIELDPATRRVTQAGRDVEVTAREFGLLEYLLRHAGTVVTKADLYEHVWETVDSARDLNVVEVYVAYLRRKLGPGAIRTVRGIGYTISEPTMQPRPPA
jgi:DNA-binding response OmpR family regulator